MYYIYFDESKYPERDFIIGSFVFCKKDPTSFIDQTLSLNGFDPSIFEYKSSIHFGRNPKMAEVRKCLKVYLYENCFFGMLVLPHSELKDIGAVALNALQQFLEVNNFRHDNIIYFDEGIFTNRNRATELIKALNLSENTFHIEQNSKKIKGIQLADLCSHCLTTILREAIGDLTKIVKVPLGSSYDLDGESEIGFDIWASIRYCFLHERNKVYNEDADQEINYTFNVEPYGLHISHKFEKEFETKVRKTFGTVFLGCIH